MRALLVVGVDANNQNLLHAGALYNALASTNPIDEQITLGLVRNREDERAILSPGTDREIAQPLQVGHGAFDCQWLAIGRFSNTRSRARTSSGRFACTGAQFLNSCP